MKISELFWASSAFDGDRQKNERARIERDSVGDTLALTCGDRMNAALSAFGMLTRQMGAVRSRFEAFCSLT